MDTTYTTSTYSDVGSSNPVVAGTLLAMYGIFMLLSLAVVLVSIISLWKLFVKAGKPGWAAIIPVYNNIVQLEIAGRPAWWVILMMFVPFFGAWVGAIALIDFIRSYQRSGLWLLFLVVLPWLAYPMFAFSAKTQYCGPIAKGWTGFMPAPVPEAPLAPTQSVDATHPQNSVQPTPPQL